MYSSPAGDCFHARTVIELPDSRAGRLRPDCGVPQPEVRSGRITPEDTISVSPSSLSLLFEYAPERAIFFDTETTGLSLGAGTVPFLIGIAFFSTAGLEVHQVFMRDYHEESAGLRLFSNLLEDAGTERDMLVSFNGRGFDAHLVASRFRLYRMEDPLAAFIHLDLLHPSRRIWRRTLESCSLGSIEKDVLNISRVDDIDGALIPAAYHRYLRTGCTEDIVRIVEHNRIDMASLAVLAMRLNGLLTGRSGLVGNLQPAELLGLAGALFSQNLFGKVNEVLSGIRHVEDTGLRWDILKLRSLSLKKLGRLDDAMLLWMEMTGFSIGFDPFPYEELAKAEEHRMGRPAEALKVVERAFRRLERAAVLGFDEPRNLGQRLRHRRARLIRKCEG